MPSRVLTYDKLTEIGRSKAKEWALQKQVRPEDVIAVLDTADDGTPLKVGFEAAPSKTGATVRGFAEGLFPTGAGVATGVAAAPSLAGSLVVGGGTALAAGAAQNYLLKKLWPSAARQLEIDKQVYPKLTTAAQAASALGPQKQFLLEGGKGAARALFRGAPREAGQILAKEAGSAKNVALNLGVGGAVGGGFEGYQQLREGEFSPGRLTTAIAANALLGGGAPRRIPFAGANRIRNVFGATPLDTRGVPTARVEETPGIGSGDMKADILAWHANKTPEGLAALQKKYGLGTPEAIENTAIGYIRRDEEIAAAAKKEQEKQDKAKAKEEKKAKDEAEAAAEKAARETTLKEFDVNKVLTPEKNPNEIILRQFRGSEIGGQKIDRKFLEELQTANPEGFKKLYDEALKKQAAEEAEAEAKKAAPKVKKPTKAADIIEADKDLRDRLMGEREAIKQGGEPPDVIATKVEALDAEIAKINQRMAETETSSKTAKIVKAKSDQEAFLTGSRKVKFSQELNELIGDDVIPKAYVDATEEEGAALSKLAEDYAKALAEITKVPADKIIANAPHLWNRAFKLANNYEGAVRQIKSELSRSAKALQRRGEIQGDDVEDIVAAARSSKTPIRGGEDEGSAASMTQAGVARAGDVASGEATAGKGPSEEAPLKPPVRKKKLTIADLPVDDFSKGDSMIAEAGLPREDRIRLFAEYSKRVREHAERISQAQEPVHEALIDVLKKAELVDKGVTHKDLGRDANVFDYWAGVFHRLANVWNKPALIEESANLHRLSDTNLQQADYKSYNDLIKLVEDKSLVDALVAGYTHKPLAKPGRGKAPSLTGTPVKPKAKGKIAKPAEAAAPKFVEGQTYTLKSKLGDRPVRVVKARKSSADVLDIENGGKLLTVKTANLSQEAKATEAKVADETIKEIADDPEAAIKTIADSDMAADVKEKAIARIREIAASNKPKKSKPVEPPKSDIQSDLSDTHMNPFGVMFKYAVKGVGKIADAFDNALIRPWAGGEIEVARALPANPKQEDYSRAASAEYLRNVKADNDRTFTKLTNQFLGTIESGLKGLKPTEAEIRKVTQHADFINDLGASPYTLTPREQKLFDVFDASRVETAGERIADGPYINNRRQLKPDPNWSMHAIMDKDVRVELLNRKGNWKRYEDDYANWYMSHTPKANREDAIKFLDELLGRSASKTTAEGPTAATLRKAEGIGLPPSMREKNIVNRMFWNAHITAADLAWHRTVERDPKAAVMLGVGDDGRGGKYDLGVNEQSDPVLQAPYVLPDIGYGRQIARNRRGEKWVEALNAEMALPRRAHTDVIEKWTAVANSMPLGTWTATRDVAGSFGILTRWLDAREAPAVFNAMRSVFAGDRAALQKGQVRAKFTADFQANERAIRDLPLKFADIMRKYQGRDLIERGLRQVIAEIGSAIAPARLQRAIAGDREAIRFMEEMAGKDWRHNLFDQKAHANMMDRIGQRFVDTVQGNYSADYLPGWLLRSSDKQFFRALLTLSRWSFERSRRFKNEIIKPMAEDGNIKPLLKETLGYAIAGTGLDALTELILDRKPRELTWKEFFGLNTEDKRQELAYTLAAKSSIMGLGGMFTQLADYYQKFKHGEGMFAIKNPAHRMAADTVGKLINYVSAYGGPLEEGFWSHLAELPYEILVDEIQLARMVRSGLDSREESGAREERILDRLQGFTKPSLKVIKDVDPFSPISKLKKAETPEEIQSKLPELTNYYQRHRTRAPASIPTAMERRVARGYYPFVEAIQGKEKAGQRFEYDARQRVLSELKKATAQVAWSQAEAARAY